MIKQNQRKTGTEQYYTRAQDAFALVAKLLNVYDCTDRTFIEPAGGTGSFIQALIKSGVKKEKILSWDIEPLHPMVKKTKNFISENLEGLRGCIAITNPPFGRANSLNIDFFNKLSMHCDCIAFICPRSWRKWSVIDKLNKNFHLILDEDLNINYDYLGNEKKSTNKLRTCFQVWEKRSEKRSPILVVDRGYITKTTPKDADVQLTIFGRGCGTHKTTFERVPNTTKMFIRVNRSWVYEALSAVDFSRFYLNTAFVEALSIKEINFLLNEYADANGLS